MEVIYTGLHQTPERVVSAAVQESVDGIGLSILSGAHMTLIPKVLKLLKDKNSDDIFVFAGGIIPANDILKLKEMGVAEIFTPGAETTDIIDFVHRTVAREIRQ